MKEHHAIIFNGDNYSEEWHKEAEKRGLPNLKTSVDALPAVSSKEGIALLGRYNVLSEREVESRTEIYVERYVKDINVESRLTLEITPDGFKANGVHGYPADLGLAQHEWAILHDIAKAEGMYAPKLLGPAAQQFRDSFDRLTAVLKSAFPQVPGQPLRRTGTGACETAFTIRLAGRSLDGSW